MSKRNTKEDEVAKKKKETKICLNGFGTSECARAGHGRFPSRFAIAAATHQKLPGAQLPI